MSIEKLIADLKTGNDRQRRSASYKLSKLKDPSTVPHLIASFKNDHIVRRNIISALTEIGTEDAIEFLESDEVKPYVASKKNTSASESIRTKGCLLSVGAVIITLFGGGLIVAFLSDAYLQELPQTQKLLWYGVIIAGGILFYSVRAFYNDKADKIDATEKRNG